MLRAILVALDGSPWRRAATTLALDWAARFDARLIGLGVLDEPSIDRARAGAHGRVRLQEAPRRDAARRCPSSRARASSTISGHAVPRRALPATVLEDIGDPAQHILREAQRCDVVILGRETHFHFETQDRPDATLGQVIRTSPRPVVVVPRELPEGRRHRGRVRRRPGGRPHAADLRVARDRRRRGRCRRDGPPRPGRGRRRGGPRRRLLDRRTGHRSSCVRSRRRPRRPRSCSKRFAAAAPACS